MKRKYSVIVILIIVILLMCSACAGGQVNCSNYSGQGDPGNTAGQDPSEDDTGMPVEEKTIGLPVADRSGAGWTLVQDHYMWLVGVSGDKALLGSGDGKYYTADFSGKELVLTENTTAQTRTVRFWDYCEAPVTRFELDGKYVFTDTSEYNESFAISTPFGCDYSIVTWDLNIPPFKLSGDFEVSLLLAGEREYDRSTDPDAVINVFPSFDGSSVAYTYDTTLYYDNAGKEQKLGEFRKSHPQVKWLDSGSLLVYAEKELPPIEFYIALTSGELKKLERIKSVFQDYDAAAGRIAMNEILFSSELGRHITQIGIFSTQGTNVRRILTVDPGELESYLYGISLSPSGRYAAVLFKPLGEMDTMRVAVIDIDKQEVAAFSCCPRTGIYSACYHPGIEWLSDDTLLLHLVNDDFTDESTWVFSPFI